MCQGVTKSNTFYSELEIDRYLLQAHRHPEPPDLILVYNNSRVVQGGALKWDVVEDNL